MAIEEAFLAQHGFSPVNSRGHLASDKSVPCTYQEVADSNREQECQSKFQASLKLFLSLSLIHFKFEVILIYI